MNMKFQTLTRDTEWQLNELSASWPLPIDSKEENVLRINIRRRITNMASKDAYLPQS